MTHYVIVRQTLDWERATVDDLFDDFARETARAWERTFNQSYLTCRAPHQGDCPREPGAACRCRPGA